MNILSLPLTPDVLLVFQFTKIHYYIPWSKYYISFEMKTVTFITFLFCFATWRITEACNNLYINEVFTQIALKPFLALTTWTVAQSTAPLDTRHTAPPFSSISANAVQVSRISQFKNGRTILMNFQPSNETQLNYFIYWQLMHGGGNGARGVSVPWRVGL